MFKYAYLIIFIFFVMTPIVSSAYAKRIAVVVNSNIKISTLQKKLIKKIFLGELHNLPEMTFIVPVEQKNDKLKKIFHKKITGKSLQGLTKHWAKIVFTGRGQKPDELSSDMEIITRIKNDSKAIGYVEEKNAIEKGVKIVFVIDDGA